MGIIGIICNPQSGKDIRRLMTSATTIDDNEKLNIVERIVISANLCGNNKIYIMPDRLGYGKLLIQKKSKDAYGNNLKNLEILEMSTFNNAEDSTNFAKAMEAMNADVLIALGGDGTSRAAAKGIKKTPLISMSTGTNNAFPQMVEGTVVGMAAACIASGYKKPELFKRCKKIEIYKNGKLEDIALVDLVICKNAFVGSKAVLSYEEIESVIVTQCSMASIGFSALVGSGIEVDENNDFGAMADFDCDGFNTLAPISAGKIIPVNIKKPRKILLNSEVKRKMNYFGTIALDGEREITFKPGDELTFIINREGPLRADVERIIEVARREGFFLRGGK